MTSMEDGFSIPHWATMGRRPILTIFLMLIGDESLVTCLPIYLSRLLFALWVWAGSPKRQRRFFLCVIVLTVISIVCAFVFAVLHYAAQEPGRDFFEVQVDAELHRMVVFIVSSVSSLALMIAKTVALKNNWRSVTRSSLSNLMILLTLMIIGLYGAGTLLAWRLIDTSHLHDTYYMVFEVWRIMLFIAILVGFALIYRHFRHFFGVNFRRVLGYGHGLTLALGMIFAGGTYLNQAISPPQLARYPDYNDAFVFYDHSFMVAAFVTLFSSIVFGICILEAVYRRLRHGKEPDRYDDRPDLHF